MKISQSFVTYSDDFTRVAWCLKYLPSNYLKPYSFFLHLMEKKKKKSPPVVDLTLQKCFGIGSQWSLQDIYYEI